MAIEIVDFPINSMVDLSIACKLLVHQRLFDPNLNLLNLRSLMDDIASKLKTWGPGAPQTKCSGALEERALKARAMWDMWDLPPSLSHHHIPH